MPDEQIGYAEAQRYPGGIEKFLFDKVIALETNGYDDTEVKASIKALEDEIGSDDKATTIKGRIKTLEDAA